MRVLRLCSVFEPPAGVPPDPRFDPVGGMQSHTGQLTHALDERGVAQTVVTAWRPGAPVVETIGTHSQVFRFGVPTRRFRQFYSLPAARLLPTAAKDADIVHVHLGEDLAVVPLAAWTVRQRRLPLVLTVHCSLRHTLRVTDLRTAVLKGGGGALEVWGVRRADAVVALTSRLARLLTAGRVDPSRVHVVPSGIDPRRFAGPAPADPTPEAGHPRVVFVGRLTPQKGVATLVAAAGRLRSPARIVVVGDGPLRPFLEDAAARQGVADRVVFHGLVAHQQVPAHLRHADVVVVPSTYEELGSVVLEAMAAGAPVVASAVGGIPEVVTDGVTGRIVPPQDPAALAAALDDVITDPATAGRLAAAAAERVARDRWDVLAGRVLDVYRTVLAGAGRPAPA